MDALDDLDCDPVERKAAQGVLGEEARCLGRRTISRSAFNKEFMDVGLVGPAVVCDSKEGACDEMNRNLRFLDKVKKGAKGEGHKYTIDVGESFDL